MNVLRLNLILLLFFSLTCMTMAKDIAVKIVPEHKIKTSNPRLKYGDDAEFLIKNDVEKDGKIYIKKGEKVVGVITKLVDNDWYGEAAKVTIEDFYTQNVRNEVLKLGGVIVKSGNPHANILGAMDTILIVNLFTMFVRGGEIQISPKKDEFTLFLKD